MRTSVLHGSQDHPNTYHHDAGFGEFYVAETGVSYSDPTIHNFFQQREGLQDLPLAEPWLAAEAGEVLAASEQSSMVLLEGDLGAGKSTVLFGARTLLRESGRPYIVINGHFLNMGPAIARSIRRASRQEQLVVYDSLDYLFLRNGHNRLSKRARGPVTEALGQHIENGGSVIGTMHTGPWMDRYSTPELQGELHQLTDGATIHRVRGYMPSDEELFGLCSKVVNGDYAALYVTYAQGTPSQTARTYRVAKLLARQVGGAEGLRGMPQDQFDALITEIDGITRAKMGATPDYALLPGNDS